MALYGGCNADRHSVVCGFVGPVCDKGNIRIREGRCINEARHDTNGRTGSGEKETDLGRRLLANMALRDHT